MSNVYDFPTDPPPDDPENPGKLLPGILEQEIIGAFRTGATPRTTRLQFLTPGAFCASFTHRDWLIDGVMERMALGQLFGASQTLKSFLAIDMGLCIAAGIPWHGHNVRQGAVAYICGEGRSGLGRRMRAWGVQHGIEIDNLPFYITDRAALLCDERSSEQTSVTLSAMTEAHSQICEFVIIDTLARCFGGDENSTADMNAFIQHIDQHFRMYFGCTVMLIHHVGHHSKDRGRGSSALHAALDFELRTTRGKGSDIVRVDCTKEKDDEALPTWHFAYHKVTIPPRVAGGEAAISLILLPTDRRPVRGADKKLTENQERLLLTLANLAPGGTVYSVEALRDACKTGGMARTTFNTACSRMEECGFIRCSWEQNSEKGAIFLTAAGNAKLEAMVPS